MKCHPECEDRDNCIHIITKCQMCFKPIYHWEEYDYLFPVYKKYLIGGQVVEVPKNQLRHEYAHMKCIKEFVEQNSRL